MTQDWAKKQVTSTVVAHTRCDACRKVAEGDPDNWVEVRSWHGEWGNDSVESFEYRHACSPACLGVVFAAAVEDVGGMRSGRIAVEVEFTPEALGPWGSYLSTPEPSSAAAKPLINPEGGRASRSSTQEGNDG